MAVKSIVVGLAMRGQPEDAGRDYALSMAASLGAKVSGIAYALEPAIPFSVFPEYAAGLLDRHRADALKQAEASQSAFVQAAQKAGVPHACVVERGTLERATARFAQRLRVADMAVLTQHESDDYAKVGDVFMEAGLLYSGRPVIVVPRSYRAEFSAGRVLIAWDGSLSAARALAGVMPLLSDKSRVDVLALREDSKADDLGGGAVVDYLRLHDINAELTAREVMDIPGAILDFADASRASLVAMGGYGKSRFREFIFGGATQLMLKEMNVPALMAH